MGSNSLSDNGLTYDRETPDQEPSRGRLRSVSLGDDAIQAWGFKYKTCAFCWVKTNAKKGGIYSGMGHWTNANAELCLLATKGHPHRVRKDIKQIVMSPVGRHSKKPDEVRGRIEALLGGGVK